MAAVDQVFSTAELLEWILKDATAASLGNLSRAQAVCHTWKDIIANSPTLQRALFLAPAPIELYLVYTIPSLLTDIHPHQRQLLYIPQVVASPLPEDTADAKVVAEVNPRLVFSYTNLVCRIANIDGVNLGQLQDELRKRRTLFEPPYDCPVVQIAGFVGKSETLVQDAMNKPVEEEDESDLTEEGDILEPTDEEIMSNDSNDEGDESEIGSDSDGSESDGSDLDESETD